MSCTWTPKSCAWKSCSCRRGRPTARSSGRSPRCRAAPCRSEEHTSELQSACNLACRLLLDKKKSGTSLVGKSRGGGRRSHLVHVQPASKTAGHHRRPPGRRAPEPVARAVSYFFFFSDAHTTNFHPFPPPAALGN